MIPASGGRHQSTFGNLNGNGLGFEFIDRRLMFIFHDSTGLNSAHAKQSVQLGKRVVVAGVFDGRTIKLFLNGELQATTSVTGDKPSPFRLKLGAMPDGRDQPHRFYTGIFESVRISAEALYSDSYEPVYQLEPDRSTVLLLKLEKGEGDVAYDSSSRKNHCQIFGAKWITLEALASGN